MICIKNDANVGSYVLALKILKLLPLYTQCVCVCVWDCMSIYVCVFE